MSNIDIINGLFVYKPKEPAPEVTYSYNGVVLPPIPCVCAPTS